MGTQKLRKKPIDKYPILTYLSRYYHFERETGHRNYAQLKEKRIRHFLDSYPEHRTPDDFTTEDILDYIQCWNDTTERLNYSLTFLKQFWTWMFQRQYAYLNVFFSIRVARPKQNRRLTLEEHSRLMQEFFEPWSVEFYALLIEGKKVRDAAEAAGVSLTTAWRYFKTAATRADLAWVKPHHVARLTLEISRQYLSQKVRESLLVKA